MDLIRLFRIRESKNSNYKISSFATLEYVCMYICTITILQHAALLPRGSVSGVSIEHVMTVTVSSQQHGSHYYQQLLAKGAQLLGSILSITLHLYLLSLERDLYASTFRVALGTARHSPHQSYKLQVLRQPKDRTVISMTTWDLQPLVSTFAEYHFH